MLVSDIIQRVRRAFGDTNSVELTDSDIMRWINDGMREVVIQADLLQQKSTTSSVSGVANYAVPTDLLKMHSLKYDGVGLEFVSLEQANELFPNKDSSQNEIGTPTHYWVWGDELYLQPVPATAITQGIKCYYNRSPVEVTATSDTPEIPLTYHNRLVEFCMAQAYELDQDNANAQSKLNQFQNNLQVMASLSQWENQDSYPFITDLSDSYGC